MRVKLSVNAPLPLLKAWFPLPLQGSIASFKALLCTSVPALHALSPAALRLSIDGFELLDCSDLTVVKDGDLISIDKTDVNVTAPSVKRKRPLSSSSSESESETTSSTESDSSESSDATSSSSSDESLPPRNDKKSAQEQPRPPGVRPYVAPRPPASHSGTAFVPPGYGKPQTRSRNLRRRIKRMHQREVTAVDPVSGANATMPSKESPALAIEPDTSQDSNGVPTLLSLSLRNKNKAKNFKSLINKPLAPKIIFDDDDTPGEMARPASSPQVHRLVPPSSRTSLPPNLFVTSVDVEAGMYRGKKKSEMQVEHEENDVTLDYGDDTAAEPEKGDVIAEREWDTLERPTSERQVSQGMLVGYRALGINPVTCTPEQRLTLGHVVTCDCKGIVVRPLQTASFSGPVGPEEEEAELEEYTWDDIINGDWRVCPS